MTTFDPTRSAGAAAASTARTAAGLVATVALASRNWNGGPGIAARADAIGERLEALSKEDAVAVAMLVSASRSDLREPPGSSEDSRLAALAAARPPCEIGEAALEIADLADETMERGARAMRGDAGVAGMLARAAALAAALIADENLAAADGVDEAETASLRERVESVRRELESRPFQRGAGEGEAHGS